MKRILFKLLDSFHLFSCFRLSVFHYCMLTIDTHRNTHAHTHIHTRILTLIHARTCDYINMNTQTYAHIHTSFTPTLTRTHPRVRALTQAYSQISLQTLTYTDCHTGTLLRTYAGTSSPSNILTRVYSRKIFMHILIRKPKHTHSCNCA